VPLNGDGSEALDAVDGAQILLVDDDPNQSEMYKVRLERLGYRVALAPGPDEALEAVQEQRPDVILLDIAMKSRDGLSALQDFLDLDPSLPVILHTAYPSYADNFMAWAAEACVVKSQSIDRLVEAIERAVAAGRERQRQRRGQCP